MASATKSIEIVVVGPILMVKWVKRVRRVGRMRRMRRIRRMRRTRRTRKTRRIRRIRRTRRMRRARKTRRTRRGVVSSARTFKVQPANTDCQKIHACWGVTNAQDTLGRSGCNLPLFLDIPLGGGCGRVDEGLQGGVRQREALAA